MSTPTEERSPARAGSFIDRLAEERLRPYLDKWRERFRTNPVTGLPLTPLRERDDDAITLERLAFRTGKGLQLALNVFSPVCAAIFLLSFAWDYEGLLRSCSIAGLIGFGTNWVAIQMLFRPREVRPVFGQGLIPSQRDEIIRKVADEVIEKLINERIIKQEIDESRLISRLTAETTREIRRIVHDPEFVADTKALVLSYAGKLAQSEAFRDELLATVEERVQGFLGKSFATWFLSRLRGVWREALIRIVDKELAELPETLDRLVGEIDTALDHLPAYIESRQEAIDAMLTRVVMSLIREIDVRRVVMKQLSTVTSEQLETGFREFADDKLSYITLLGGILGAVGGLVIVWPVGSLVGLTALGLLLAAADILAHALRQRSRAEATASTVGSAAPPAATASPSEAPVRGGTEAESSAGRGVQVLGDDSRLPRA